MFNFKILIPSIKILTLLFIQSSSYAGNAATTENYSITDSILQVYETSIGPVMMKDVYFKHQPGVIFSNGDPILNSKEVILTFDDGPDSKTTPHILDTLQKYNIRSIFFVLGRRIKVGNGKEILKRISSEGHAVANHSYSHPGFRGMYKKNGMGPVQAEILNTHQLIWHTTGKVYPYFRFPGGTFNNELNEALKNYGLSNWKWNVDSFDYFDCAKTIANNCIKKYTVNEMASNLVFNIKEALRKTDRGILLFHDIKPQTVKALPEVLDYLIKEGYTFVLPHPDDESVLTKEPISN